MYYTVLNIQKIEMIVIEHATCANSDQSWFELLKDSLCITISMPDKVARAGKYKLVLVLD